MVNEAADTRYNLVFAGRLLPGTDRARAERTLAAFFGLRDTTAVRPFFSGRSIPLRRNLSRAEALRLYRQLRGAGLICKVPAVDDAVDPPHAAAARGAGEGAATAPPSRPAASITPVRDAAAAPRGRARGDAAASSLTADSASAGEPAPDAAAPDLDTGSPGSAPNFFALRPALAGDSETAAEQAFARALVLAAIAATLCVVVLAVNLRFPAPPPGAEPRGPLALASLPGGGLALLLDNALLLHARSGLPRQRIAAQTLGYAAFGAPLVASSDGSLLLRGRAEDDPLWHLLRCRVAADAPHCTPVMPIPAPPAPLALRESYLGDALFLQLDDGRLLRSSPRGDIQGEAATAPPLASSPMLYREGLLLIPAPDAPLIGVYRPDAAGFGEQLDALLVLTEAGAPAAQRIVDIAAVGGDRYALVDDEEGARRLYRFDASWGSARRVELATAPDANAYLASWRDRLLLASPTQRVQQRIAPGGTSEAAFESPMLMDEYDAWQQAAARRQLVRRLGFTAPLLIAAVLLIAAALEATRAGGLRACPPRRTALLDPMPAGVRWLPTDEEQARAASVSGLALIGACLCATAGIGVFGTGARAACLLPLLLAALQARTWLLRGCGGHIGRRDGDVIVVDHDGRYFYGRHELLRHGAGFLFASAVAVPITLPALRLLDPRRLPAGVQPVEATTALGLLWHLGHPWLRALVALLLGLLVSLGAWLLTA